MSGAAFTLVLVDCPGFRRKRWTLLIISNVTFFIGDVSKPEDIGNALKKVSSLKLLHDPSDLQSGATAVIHTASPAHNLGPEIYQIVNVTGTRNIIDECLSAGVKKLVYTSSGGVVYNGQSDIVTADERLPYPEQALDAYNETKVAAEKMVLAANGQDGLLTCSIRPAGIFGPGDRQMINGFYGVVKNNQTKFQIGDNSNLADFTYVGNVAHAHLLAVDKLDQKYPLAKFRDAIPSINLSLGNHKIPTSTCHPLGPNTNPNQADQLASKRFESDWEDVEDARPVLRNRMDHFVDQANFDEDESQDTGFPIAGQAFFITNGEPVYFWDFARSVWKGLGHVPPYTLAMPAAIGLILATLAEIFSKIVGKEAGFTRFRVSQAVQNRYYDIEKSRRLLGYEPIVGLDEGMKRWTEWYRGELAKNGEVVESEKTK